MDYENIIYDVSERIATVTLNRPDAMNATTDQLYSELQHLIPRIAADPGVSVVILTGAGRGFCAGADLKASKDSLTPLQRRARHRWILKEVLEPLYKLEKPVIAAVNGAAAGAGANIALSCDIIIASEKASFIQAFAKVGLMPDLGGMFFLSRAVGINKAKELCFTARKVPAEEALALGIANKVVPHDALMDEARAMARQIAAGSPTAMAMSKRLLNMSQTATFEQMLEFEAYSQTIAYLTPEYREGVMAFREKRAPDFAGAADRASAGQD
ncbi:MULTISPECIES: enoyl-CoA hydratase/isomerase family protein [unclassified Novosphingobium]|uniref:enoyl-CoA hydratase/isomerase family protein n=1 Tax=unclassified Novosphingobium TaxID=2644732 RepID=UPI001494ADE9|nr:MULTISPECIES: enoyl-CoA hydratase-related protein [unclassified Novosphingobium]MBB3359979.1 2-(1,2-epoxy-1,2-dihydrophenyl)acetyl-CoA isomerase [Novosphingobium sp. BK256]MBB3376338.1 2-(1,2-epoxy-1,2-dihydrophenyl)acetyl-CoA isomerase [Novosphingobium sp. BK280]MBB3380781.1 2-(1,2-epoxy-1,2-dihydrophenyl)acetyl-CoA isomerase [Novosphingobium sp. BK258]MBB3422403.1 2-(1,2-epoxy-1,2-dihydrophenyl)acetyl-CoA isomerase [Novosphingobium sp. BK267]MBB3451132.1 2-(1,2-epoxy-1,2-dihydrophenyl)ace